AAPGPPPHHVALDGPGMDRPDRARARRDGAMTARPWLQDERGAVGGIEVLPLGVLVLVVGTLLVVNAWAVVDAKLAASAAAREAARAYVEAPDGGAADREARAAAAETVEGHGRDPELLEVQRTDGSFVRCERIRFEAAYPVPALVLPWIGGFERAITVGASHSEIIDPYRSGLGGEAACA
ncbi:hypothetical protein B7486_75485, partial [cyanobacterium TDX16]